MSNPTKEIRVQPIENGTVIDHIKAGQALNVLKILGISGISNGVVSVLINAPGEFGNKDVVKIEGRELRIDEADRISLIAPSATINIIRDFDVLEKKKVEIPAHVAGVVKCINSNCISNSNEPVTSKFEVMNLESGIELRCDYCERVISENIAEHLL
ncbi:aspartate carbamoyltransferase regulatory subunit [Methanohalophilus levihalophilus]|uniref:aspartate carbamoyltransferase regulatory subunit n=1 Tax=Methanohalophilus levihalophilus TaxID=1431282 RepID=UPI001AE70271|nr:aspartate carbamoyltransferase regulatory subunit [Methanohalophilus levihalophilus]MBP2029285.1 aspartate carbamoyltransferase regulatory subunit [Methanohalophilus levihalophilus]